MDSLQILDLIGQILSPDTSVPEGLARLPEKTWENVVAVSSRHLVTPAMAPALAAKNAFDDLPEDLKQYLAYVHDLNVARNTALMDQAAEIARVLNAVGIVPVMLKGMAYLFSGLHGDRGARVVGDIDCFVPEDRAEAALMCLKREGYAFLWEEGPVGHHHLPPVSREGAPAVVELHTHPIKRDFAALLSTEDFISEITALTYQGAEIGIPSPTHQAVICIEHEGLANRDDDFLRASLRGLHDLACLITGEGIDWQAVSRRFKRAGLSGTLRRYLVMARFFFSAAPDGRPVRKRLPLFIRTALRFPKVRKLLLILSLTSRVFTDRRIRTAALTYAGKMFRGEKSLAPLKHQMADRK